jgi:hypothetical protein
VRSPKPGNIIENLTLDFDQSPIPPDATSRATTRIPSTKAALAYLLQHLLVLIGKISLHKLPHLFFCEGFHLQLMFDPYSAPLKVDFFNSLHPKNPSPDFFKSSSQTLKSATSQPIPSR